MIAASSFSATAVPPLFFTPLAMRALRASSSAASASRTAVRSAGQHNTSRSSGAIMHAMLPPAAAHPN
jgi:hypothetical protein